MPMSDGTQKVPFGVSVHSAPIGWYCVTMKVLERREWEKEFSWKCSCPQCESKLEAETSDLIHTPGGGDCRESWPEQFSVTCPVCQESIRVPTDVIPKFVQKLARSRRSTGGPQYDR